MLALLLPSGGVAEEIEVMPGASGTVAVSMRDASGGSPHGMGICLYDNGVIRGGCAYGGNTMAFSDDGAEIYGYNNETSDFTFRTVAVLPTGPAVVRTAFGLISGYYTRIRSAAGRVYASGGQVIDAGRQSLVGTVGRGSAAEPDAALGRLFMLDDAGTITAWDMNLLSSLGSVNTGSSSNEHPAVGRVRLVRWGSDGLAFRDGQRIYILRTPLAGP
jgi:hypothetical protein